MPKNDTVITTVASIHKSRIVKHLGTDFPNHWFVFLRLVSMCLILKTLSRSNSIKRELCIRVSFKL